MTSNGSTRRRFCRGTAALTTLLAASWPGAGVAAEAPLAGDAAAVLRRLRDAARRRSYTGIFVVNAGGTLSSSRIAHYADGRHQLERIEALDGQMRRVYRHDDTVHVFWPKTREASIEPREMLGAFPSAGLADVAPLADAYEVQWGGLDRVAGHEAQVLTLRPRDALRYPQRLWLERQSGLLLRADTLGARGEVLESSAFSELQLDAPLQPQALLQEMRRLDGYRVQRPQMQRADLEREGWQLRQAPAAFVQVRCVRRPLRAPDRPGSSRAALPTVSPLATAALAASQPTATPGTAGDASAGLLQVTYSDGLTLVSLFVEPFDAAIHQRDGVASWGATVALTRRLDDWWLTVVGDVPLATLQQFSAAMERKRP
ncbi:MAG: MucB/RseB C-terminal domain-containing protein [Burkholderiaceae bacterium]|nr:MucB/RseB C-terminal domain-containing protein [Burkholderiaceae bacterium]